MKHLNAWKPYLILLGLVLASYYPITLFMYAFKWDMIDQFFPIRFLIGEHLQAGQLPLWNPYQNGGYPLHADPQSGAWYIPVWLMTLLPGGYSVYAVHVEFLLTLYVAGIGFYALSTYLKRSSFSSLLMAYSYCCSGFFIGNAQHLTWIVSAAFLPFVVLFYLKTLRKRKIIDAFTTGFFLYLMLSGGYPGFLIILAYILLIMLIAYGYNLYQSKQELGLFRLATLQLLIIVSALVFGAVIFYSTLEFIPLITRGEAVSMEKALWGAFTLPSFLSFILPFATCQHTGVIKTDISMANAYMGILGFVFFLLFFNKKEKSKIDYFFLVTGIVSLALSVGDALPLRAFFYRHVPFMDMFRHPAIFRIFFILPFLLLAASGLDAVLNEQKYLRRFLFISFGTGLLIAGITGLSAIKNYSGTGILDYWFDYNFFKSHATIYDHLIIQGCIQVLLLSILFIQLLWIKKYPVKWVLAFFIVTDLFIATSFNLSYTALNTYSNPKQIDHTLATQAKGFPIPVKIIAENHDETEELKPLWKNLNVFRKEIAYDGWNAFFLKSYAAFENHPVYAHTKKNGPVFLADTVSEINAPVDSARLTNRHIFLSAGEFLPFQHHRPLSTTKDTVYITGFSGNAITLTAHTCQDRIMVLYQNNTPGWTAYIDDKESPLLSANHALMALPLTSGIHNIRLSYKPPYISLFLGISILSLLGFIIARWRYP